MTDIYDKAIVATLAHDRIRDSWITGGNNDMPLHALLFRSCPSMGCCLTECKMGMADTQEDDQDFVATVKADGLIPNSQYDLERQWDGFDEDQRTEMLERFAFHNRELDSLHDREEVFITDLDDN